MSGLSFSYLIRFYLPLALSGLLMTLQQPVVTGALARTANPKEALAAYGLALSIAVMLESPIQMLLAAGATLVHDKPSLRLLQRVTTITGGTLVGLGAVLVFTPLGRIFFLDVLSVPSPVDSQALLALKTLVPWPLVVAWRRLYQGILIRQGQTRAISYGTAGRLVVIATVAFLAVAFTDWPGAMIGANALMSGAFAEALFVTGWLRLAGTLANTRKSENFGEPEPLTLSSLGRFYWPLALTSALAVLSWPLINAGISRTAEPERSLAAWPVTLSLLWLFTTPLQMLQQLSITLVNDVSSYKAICRFALGLGAVASVLLGMGSFTPLLEIFLLRFLMIPTDIANLVVSSVRLLVPLPFLTAVLAFYQGLSIGRKRTAVVRTAMVANLLMLSSVLLIGIHQSLAPGFLLAPAAMTVGLVTEVSWLWWQASHGPPNSQVRFREPEHMIPGCGQ